ncbi:MAG: PilN domain-containing protein [Clostridiales bacterium]|nr:PilN domain-containing protein [Clostridiales bacterium]
MYDLNFFQPYIKEPEKVNIKDILILSLITIIAFTIILYSILKYSELRAIKKDIFALNQILESQDNINRLNEIDKLNVKLAELESDRKEIEILEKKLTKRDIINDLLIYKILCNIPKDIVFDQLKIDDNVIEIKGRSFYKFNIAQMEYNLRNSVYFDQAFIPSITENNSYYEFTLRFITKDVATDETK